MAMLAAVGQQPLDECGPGRASALGLLEVHGDQSCRSPAVISTAATRSLRVDSRRVRLVNRSAVPSDPHMPPEPSPQPANPASLSSPPLAVPEPAQPTRLRSAVQQPCPAHHRPAGPWVGDGPARQPPTADGLTAPTRLAAWSIRAGAPTSLMTMRAPRCRRPTCRHVGRPPRRTPRSTSRGWAAGVGRRPAGAGTCGQNAISSPPNRSKVSAVPGTPGLLWVNNRPPVLVSPPPEPWSTLTAPAWETVPTSSRGAAAATSAKPSSLKSPAASCSPNSSPASTVPATWVNSRPPLADNPPVEPYSVLRAPASSAVPTSSSGAAAASSANPSCLKPPAANAHPKMSQRSATPPTWVNSRPPVAVRPAAEPGRTLTAPAPMVVPTRSLGAPAARSANPSWLKSSAANAAPIWSLASTVPPTWVTSRPPVAVRPAAEPGTTLPAPAPTAVPTASPGAPAARSTKPSWLKSAAASADPNWSPPSTLPATWVNSRPPLVVKPPGGPYSTLTTPAAKTLPTDSYGAPTARSAKPSWLKSPAANAQPNQSWVSAALPTWVNSRPPAVVNPSAEPYSTLTAPASRTPPTSSPEAPPAKSANPSPLKSPAANADPKRSRNSAVPPTWKNTCPPVPLSPLPAPYSTLTAPAMSFSPGTPTARSATPSLLKSAATSDGVAAVG